MLWLVVVVSSSALSFYDCLVGRDHQYYHRSNPYVPFVCVFACMYIFVRFSPSCVIPSTPVLRYGIGGGFRSWHVTKS